MGCFRQLETPQHFVLRFRRTGGAFLIFGLWSGGRNNTLGSKRLEFDRIGMRLNRHINETLCEIYVAIMVHARLGNDEAGRSTNSPGSYHAVHPPSMTRFWPVTYADKSLAR